jgi:hypothetical protein
VKTISPAALLCLAWLPLGVAQAGEVKSQDSMFLTPGKTPAIEALEAKKTSRCLALYGPGYAALGGSDTCIRIGGRVGVSVGTSSKHNQLIIVPSRGIGAPAPAFGGTPVGVIRQPSSGMATEVGVYVDTRTQTEMGEFGTHLSVRGVRASGALRGPDYVQ